MSIKQKKTWLPTSCGSDGNPTTITAELTREVGNELSLTPRSTEILLAPFEVFGFIIGLAGMFTKSAIGWKI